jgi:hypothetical protein
VTEPWGSRKAEPSAPLGPAPGALPYAYPPGGYYPPPPYSGFPPAPTAPRNGLGVGSLVIGILAVLTSWTVIGGLALGIVAGGTGLVAWQRARHGEASNGGAALAGAILGIAAAALSGVLVVIGIVVLQTGVLNEDYQHCLGEHNGMTQYCNQYR